MLHKIESIELPKIELPRLEVERQSNDDFMRDLIEASNIVGQYLFFSAAIVPTQPLEQTEIAILIGHMVRLSKLYDSMILLIVKKRAETAMILARSLTETVINLRYLLQHGSPDLYQKYIKASLVYEKKYWDEIEKCEEKLPAHIVQKVQSSIQKTFDQAGFKLEDVNWKDRHWGNEYIKAQQVDLIDLYEFGFRTASHFVHGTWHDLEFHHLKKNQSGYYQPNLDYTSPTPQIVDGSTIECLIVTGEYVSHMVGDSGIELDNGLQKLFNWFREMIKLYEEFRVKKQ